MKRGLLVLLVSLFFLPAARGDAAGIVLNSFESPTSTAFYAWDRQEAGSPLCQVVGGCAVGPCATVFQVSDQQTDGAFSGKVYLQGIQGGALDEDCQSRTCTDLTRTIALASFSPADWSSGHDSLVIDVQIPSGAPNLAIALLVQDSGAGSGQKATPITNGAGWTQIEYTIPQMVADGIDVSAVSQIGVRFPNTGGVCGTVYVDNLRLTDCTVPGTGIAVTKTRVPVSPSIGDPITYAITIYNSGSSTVTNLIVSDTISSIIENAATDQPGVLGAPVIAQVVSGSRYVWSATGLSMVPGASYTLTITGTTGEVCVSTRISNTAYVWAYGSCDTASAQSNATGFTLPPPFPLGTTVNKIQSSVPPGSVRYAITVYNSGGCAIRELTVVDTVSPLLVGVTTDEPGAMGAPTVSSETGGTRYVWSATGLDLSPGAAYTFTLTGAVGPVCVTTPVSNTAHVLARSTCSEVNGLTGPTGFVRAGESSPSIAVVKNLAPASPGKGDAVTYQVVVINNGTTTVTDLTVIDTVSPVLKAQGSNGPAGFAAPFITHIASGTQYIWTKSGLNFYPGSSYTFTITGTVGAVCANTTVGNTAYARAVAMCGTTEKLSNGTGFQLVAEPSIGVGALKSQTPASPGIGQPVSYRIVVTNTGSATIHTVRVVDTVSPVFVSQTTDQPGVFGAPTKSDVTGGTRYVWSATGLNMTPGTIYTFTVTGMVGSVCVQTDVSNTAVIGAVADCGSVSGLTNAVGFSINAPVMSLVVVKQQTPPAPEIGEVVTYRIVVTNSGGVTITDLAVVDTVSGVVRNVSTNGPAVMGAPGVTFLGSGTRYVWSQAGLTFSPGKSYTFTITGQVGPVCAAINVSNTACAVGRTSCAAAGDVSGAVGFSPLAPTVSLSVQKTQTPPNPGIGSTVTYRIVVRNTGSATIQALHVSDTVSGVVTGITANMPAGFAQQVISTASGTLYSWDDPGIAMGLGQIYTFTVTGTVGSVCVTTAVNNVGYAKGDNGCAEARAASNVTAFAVTAPTPNVTVSKDWVNPSSGGKSPAPAPGGAVRYTIQVANQGTGTAYTVTLVDTLPASMGSVVAITVPVGWTKTRTAILPHGDEIWVFTRAAPLAPGTPTAQVTVDLRVQEEAGGGFVLTNSAVAHFTILCSGQVLYSYVAHAPDIGILPELAGKVAKGRILVAPNVLNRSGAWTPIRVALKGDEAGVVEIRIYDEAGELVRELNVMLDGFGGGLLDLDGKDSGGRPLGSGAYWVVARGGGVKDRKAFIVTRARK